MNIMFRISCKKTGLIVSKLNLGERSGLPRYQSPMSILAAVKQYINDGVTRAVLILTNFFNKRIFRRVLFRKHITFYGTAKKSDILTNARLYQKRTGIFDGIDAD